jgi:hypothetical protein
MTDNTAAQAQETEATTGDYTPIELGDRDYRVKAVSKWRPSYVRALRNGDFDAWVSGVFHPDDVDAWIDADPTFEEIGDFANRAMTASGETPGKSSGRPTSSRTTRRK